MNEAQAIKTLSFLQAKQTKAIIAAIIRYSDKIDKLHGNVDYCLNNIVAEFGISSDVISEDWEFAEEQNKEEVQRES